MTGNLATLIKKRGPIRRIGVVGMGYVGIPAAALFADVPTVEHVYGFQRDSASSGYTIAMLNRGESPLKGEEPGLPDLLGKVAGCDAVPLTIQTLFLDERGEGIGESGAQPHPRGDRAHGPGELARDGELFRPGCLPGQAPP